MAALEREGSVTSFYDRLITAGSLLDDTILAELDSAQLFLCVVSPDFIASGYCYDKELQHAFALQEAGNLQIVSVIVEPCEWLETPLSRFMVTPRDGMAVALWDNENMAFLNVISELRRITSDHGSKQPGNDSGAPVSSSPIASESPKYIAKRSFDEIDKIKFREQGYAEIFQYFERSCRELSQTSGLSATFRKLNEYSFTCTVMNESFGRGIAHITVRMGSSGAASFGDLSWSNQENAADGSSNGWCSIGHTDYSLYFEVHGGPLFGTSRKEQLSPDGVAKFLWDSLLEQAGISYA